MAGSLGVLSEGWNEGCKCFRFLRRLFDEREDRRELIGSVADFDASLIF